jgi:hypothetical protein
VSSTVVGHFKTCLVIFLSWLLGGKSFRSGSVVGILLALGGIVSYEILRSDILASADYSQILYCNAQAIGQVMQGDRQVSGTLLWLEMCSAYLAWRDM